MDVVDIIDWINKWFLFHSNVIMRLHLGNKFVTVEDVMVEIIVVLQNFKITK